MGKMRHFLIAALLVILRRANFSPFFHTTEQESKKISKRQAKGIEEEKNYGVRFERSKFESINN
jgi:hypothetical protein